MDIRGLLSAADYEVIPLKGVLEKVATLPAGKSVTVTASPAKGIDTTIDLALEIQSMGYQAVAHLSSRLIANLGKLESIVNRLRDGGVGRVFVVGGDGDEVGDFEDGVALLAALQQVGHDFKQVGIPGYPEGHASIPDHKLRDALLAKQANAHYIATQMCFSAKRIVAWLESIRADGIELPVKIGVAGVVDPARLISVGSRIGVGDSLRYISKNRSIFRMIRPGPYKPDKLLKKVVEGAGHLGLGGLHIFTFNQVKETSDWASKY